MIRITYIYQNKQFQINHSEFSIKMGIVNNYIAKGYLIVKVEIIKKKVQKYLQGKKI